MLSRPRPTVWFPALAGVLAVAWHRERNARQGAARLAAATFETLMNAIDANDHMTGQHVRRTAAYALCVGDAVGLADGDQRKLERVALFHDIGKIHAALFDIVHEDSRLTDAERAQIATHAQRGADVLRPLAAFYPELPEGVLSHHERWDGTGYPRRLSGASIPLNARIVAIADTFDAITHSRRYHSGEGFDRGVDAIREGAGTQFDPHLVDVFLSPEVQDGVRRSFDQHAVGRHAPDREVGKPRRAVRGDRRTDAVEESVPDVRFRWRGPSAVTVTGEGDPGERAGTS
jgi:putative two-component system response regulator